MKTDASERHARIHDAIAAFLDDNGRYPTVKELSDATGFEYQNTLRIMGRMATKGKLVSVVKGTIAYRLPEVPACINCGSTMSDDELAAQREQRPALLSCCPERKLALDRRREASRHMRAVRRQISAR